MKLSRTIAGPAGADGAHNAEWPSLSTIGHRHRGHGRTAAETTTEAPEQTGRGRRPSPSCPPRSVKI